MKKVIIAIAVTIFTPESLLLSQQNKNFLFQPSGSNFLIYNRAGNNIFLHHRKLLQWRLHGNIKKLSSSKRITSAADDPSGLAVAEKMKGVINQLQRESMNMQDYRNYLNYYDHAVARDISALKRIRLLILRSAGGILTREDREINQGEINQFLKEINMNARFSTFNGVRAIPQLTVKNLGLSGVDVVRNLYGSMPPVDRAIKKLLSMRGRAGAQSNIFTMRIKGKAIHMLNLQQSESRISDLDMADEIRSLTQNSVLYRTNLGIIIKSRK